MTTIASRLQAVRRRIDAAAVAAGRTPEAVRLIAVSKTFPAQAVCEAIAAGQTAFGENYLQEAVAKIAAVAALLDTHSGSQARDSRDRDAGAKAGGETHRAAGGASPRSVSLLRPPEWHEDSASRQHSPNIHSSGVASPHAGPLLRPPEWREDSASRQHSPGIHSSGVASPHAGPLLRPPEWHFIGPIQSNKTRVIAEVFSWVHSVDRLKIAQRLSDARPAQSPPLDICIQVNVSGEASKGGVSPEAAAALAHEIAALPRLRLRGLMAIPEPTADDMLLRRRFAMLRELRERICADGLALDTLSMGMSDDLEAAIAEGATMVRVGRAIFGERTAPAAR